MAQAGHGCSFLQNNNKQKFKILAVEPIQFNSLVSKWGEKFSPFYQLSSILGLLFLGLLVIFCACSIKKPGINHIKFSKFLCLNHSTNKNETGICWHF